MNHEGQVFKTRYPRVPYLNLLSLSTWKIYKTSDEKVLLYEWYIRKALFYVNYFSMVLLRSKNSSFALFCRSENYYHS